MPERERTNEVGDVFEYTRDGKRLRGFDKNVSIKDMLETSAREPYRDTYHHFRGPGPTGCSVWAYRGQEIPNPFPERAANADTVSE